jgi:hypothetical protein
MPKTMAAPVSFPKNRIILSAVLYVPPKALRFLNKDLAISYAE